MATRGELLGFVIDLDRMRRRVRRNDFPTLGEYRALQSDIKSALATITPQDRTLYNVRYGERPNHVYPDPSTEFRNAETLREQSEYLEQLAALLPIGA